MSHNNSQEHLRLLALEQIANQAKTDLFYLCKHILGYDLMTHQAHSDLCNYTKGLLGAMPPVQGGEGLGARVDTTPGGKGASDRAPHTTRELQSGTGARMTSPPTYSQPNNPIVLDVQEADKDPLTKESLYKPAISDTKNPLVVQYPMKGSLEELQEQVELEPEQLTHKAEDSYDKDKNFLLLLMPRGSFKSSVVTIGFSLQYILNHPDARVLIDSETYSKCVAFMREIRGHLESNEKFREIFKYIYGMYPDSKKDDKWADGEFTISARKRQRKEPTFSAGGIGTTKTGMHYDLIIGDDMVSENNITNKEQIDKVIDHYKLALSLLDPGSPLIIIGTRWDYMTCTSIFWITRPTALMSWYGVQL